MHGRPREDAAPEDPRRPARPARHRRRASMAQHGIAPIDLLVVNLYPFEETVARPGLHARRRDREHRHRRPGDGARGGEEPRTVACVVDPADYAARARGAGGARRLHDAPTTRSRSRPRRSRTPRATTRMIANYLAAPTGSGARERFPGDAAAGLRQSAGPALRREPAPAGGVLSRADAPRGAASPRARQLQGKELSYNNIADADAAMECVRQFERAGLRDRQARQSLRRGRGRHRAARPTTSAFRTDPTSAFGGIIAFNRELDAATAAAIVERQFVEVLVAPAVRAGRAARCSQPSRTCACSALGDLEPRACRRARISQRHRAACWCRRATRAQRRRRRPEGRHPAQAHATQELARPAVRLAGAQVREVQRDRVRARRHDDRHRRRPDEPRVLDARSPRIKAADAKLPVRRHRDGVRRVLPVPRRHRRGRRAGIRAVIQPGGSMRDAEVIAAADEHGMAMVFTGMRHFRH